MPVFDTVQRLLLHGRAVHQVFNRDQHAFRIDRMVRRQQQVPPRLSCSEGMCPDPHRPHFRRRWMSPAIHAPATKPNYRSVPALGENNVITQHERLDGALTLFRRDPRTSRKTGRIDANRLRAGRADDRKPVRAEVIPKEPDRVLVTSTPIP